MRWERRSVLWPGAGLAASGLLAASVWAQVPVAPTGPAPAEVCEKRPGPIHRAWNHTFRVLQDNWMGYPQEFVEPPPGFYVAEAMGLMKSKADTHRFTLYRTDFLDGTDQFSPTGASRFNIMSARCRTWPGPILIEWSPDKPGLSESRRQAVLAALQATGAPMIPERVAIGPSPYPGMYGAESGTAFKTFTTRYSSAPSSFAPGNQLTGLGGASGGGGTP